MTQIRVRAAGDTAPDAKMRWVGIPTASGEWESVARELGVERLEHGCFHLCGVGHQRFFFLGRLGPRFHPAQLDELARRYNALDETGQLLFLQKGYSLRGDMERMLDTLEELAQEQGPPVCGPGMR